MRRRRFSPEPIHHTETPVAEQDGLICAYRFDGKGSATELGWEALEPVAPGSLVWVHLHLEGSRTQAWLKDHSGLPPLIAEALTYEEVRPRSTVVGEGMLVTLRGVNLNPGADPEDMVAVRMYVDRDLVVTVRRRRLMAVQDIRDRLAVGKGPKNAGELLAELAARLVERMGPVIDDLDDGIDDIEARAVDAAHAGLRAELWDRRREAIGLRRYIAPQRDAMTRLYAERVDWIDEPSAQRLRECADRVTRYVEDLDAARERATLVQDELNSRMTEHMNRNTYVLSVIAAIFLPLSLITGLLGINVGGIPGEKWEWAFWLVTFGIGACGVGGFFLLRRLRWL